MGDYSLNKGRIETELATLEIDSNEVLTLTLKSCDTITEIDQVALHLLLCSEPYQILKLQLLDIRACWNTQQNDVRLLMNQNALFIPYARAVIIPSEANTSSIQAILILSKDVKYPVRFFTSKIVAYDWLMSFHTQSIVA
jgi:hypothetical protein